jgi:hypothetical protein
MRYKLRVGWEVLLGDRDPKARELFSVPFLGDITARKLSKIHMEVMCSHPEAPFYVPHNTFDVIFEPFNGDLTLLELDAYKYR